MATLTDREAKPAQMPMMSPGLSVGNQQHPKMESNASAAGDPLGQSMTEHGNTLSINIDVHFPVLPCSELVLEVMDTSGKERLRLDGQALSKLRTNCSSPAGPARPVGPAHRFP